MSLEHQVTIAFKNGEVNLENTPLCTAEQVQQANELVGSLYLHLGANLPEGHPWKKAKIDHAAHTRQAGALAVRDIQNQLVKGSAELLDFVAFAHDLGRPIEARRQVGLLTEAEGVYHEGHHGILSVKALESENVQGTKGVLTLFDQRAQDIIKYVIEHHADPKTPVLPENPTKEDKYKYVFTCLLRDMDKLSTFANRTDGYLNNEVNKVKQAMLNKLNYNEEHPNAEWGTIDPPELIDTFSSYQAIKRGTCRSYEAFMLQYLAWTFDVNLKSMVGEAIKTGVVSKLLNYFEKRLPKDQYQRISTATSEYLKMQGFMI